MAALRVLRALLDAPEFRSYGFDLLQATGLKSGTVYPILRRLESEKWAGRTVEDVDPRAEGRPARTYYTLTPTGVGQARQALAEASDSITPRRGTRLGSLADGSAQ